MRKVFLGTAALIAASVVVAPGARASDPIKLGLGGFMAQTFGYVENDSDFEANGRISAADTPPGEIKNWDQKQTSEIHFKGSAKLDNGITVSAQVELNTDDPDNFTVDEVYAKVVSPSLGTLILGREEGATALLGHKAPISGMINVDGGGVSEIRPNSFILPPHGVHAQNISTTSDEMNMSRITYLSSRFNGFGIGLTFNPHIDYGYLITQPGGKNVKTSYSVALAYDNTLGGIKVGADVGYYKRNKVLAPYAKFKSLRGGLSLSYAGFTLGGGYIQYDVENKTGLDINVDGRQWSVGLTYAAGPYGVGVSRSRARAKHLVDDGDDKTAYTVVGGTYTLGPGVIVAADLMFAGYDEEDAATVDNNGWGITTSLVLAF